MLARAWPQSRWRGGVAAHLPRGRVRVRIVPIRMLPASARWRGGVAAHLPGLVSPEMKVTLAAVTGSMKAFAAAQSPLKTAGAWRGARCQGRVNCRR